MIAYRVGDASGWAIEPAGLRRDWMDATIVKVAYRCLPLSIANQSGWVIRSPHSFRATWIGGDEGHCTRLEPFGGDDPRFSMHIRTNFGTGIVSFALPWVFRTPPGYGLIVRGPVNMVRRNAAPLEGLVETDWAPYTFTMNWKIVQPHIRVEFRREEPICMITPYPLELLEQFRPRVTDLREDAALEAEFKAWHAERRTHGEASKALPYEAKEFKLRYLRGEHMDGASHQGHRSRLNLSPFEDRMLSAPGEDGARASSASPVRPPDSG